MNKLLQWIRTMFDRLFHRKRHTVQEDNLSKELRHEKEWVEGRVTTTNRGGPNMPRYQPCPDCGRWVRRQHKTAAGADYYCKRCQAGNFVRAR